MQTTLPPVSCTKAKETLLLFTTLITLFLPYLFHQMKENQLLEKDQTTMMTMPPMLPNYNLPTLPTKMAAANPEYKSTAGYNANAAAINPTQNTATLNNATNNNQLTQQQLQQKLNQVYSPTTNNSATQNTATQNTQTNNNQLNQQKLNQVYSPTYNSATQNTATQNTQTNNQQLNQQQLNQQQNIYNQYMAYINNNRTNNYTLPPLNFPPQQPPVVPPPVYPPPVTPPPVTPEPPKQDGGGGFPWLPILLGGAALFLLPGLFGGNKSEEKPPVTPPKTDTPPPVTIEPPTSKPPKTIKPPKSEPHPKTPPEVHRTAYGSIWDDPMYGQGKGREKNVENHTTGNITYFDDASDSVHSQVKVTKSKVEEKGTGKQLTFVEEFKLTNDGKTVKVTNNKVYIGTKELDTTGSGTEKLGADGTVSWNNGIVTIETAEGKHVISTVKFEMEENIAAYGPAYLEVDSTSNSKELDVSGAVGDGMNAQLAGFAPPSKFLRSVESFVDAKQSALTKSEMESILGGSSTPPRSSKPDSKESVALW